MANNNFLKKNILEQLGLANLPLEEQVMLSEQIVDLVQKKVILEITKKLTNEDLSHFMRLIEANNELAMAAFLGEKIPDFEKMIEKQSAEVGKMLLKKVKE